MLVWVSCCGIRGWIWPCTPNTRQTAGVCPVVRHWRLLAVLQEGHNLFYSPSVPCVGPAGKGCCRETWNGPNLKVQMQNTHPERCSGQHFSCTLVFAVTDTDKILPNLVKPVPAQSSWAGISKAAHASLGVPESPPACAAVSVVLGSSGQGLKARLQNCLHFCTAECPVSDTFPCISFPSHCTASD